MPNITPQFETFNPKTNTLTRGGVVSPQPSRDDFRGDPNLQNSFELLKTQPLAGELLDINERTDPGKIFADKLEPEANINMPDPVIPQGDPDVEVAGATETVKTVDDIDEPTEAEGQQDDWLKSIAGIRGNLAGLIQEKADLEKEAGLPGLKQTLKGLKDKINVRTAEYNALSESRSGIGLTQGDVMGQRAQIQRAKGAEIGILQAQVQAAQGDVQAAQETINNAINLKYQIQMANLDTYNAQLDAIAPQLNRDEQKRADEKRKMVDEEKQRIADQKEQEKLEANMAIQGRKFIRDESELFAIAQEAKAMGLNSDDLIIKMPNGDIYKRSPKEIKALDKLDDVSGVGGGGGTGEIGDDGQTEISYGQSILDANPDATNEDLKISLLENTNLNVTEINALLAKRTQGQEAKENIAVGQEFIEETFTTEELNEALNNSEFAKVFKSRASEAKDFYDKLRTAGVTMAMINEARESGYTNVEILESIMTKVSK